MTLAEYFAQDKYFSESTQELMPIDEMPFPHAMHAAKKLNAEHGTDFIYSRLGEAFMERLSPPQECIQDQLKRSGTSAHIVLGSTTNVRSKFYHAGRRLGVKVKTHKKGHYVTAEVVTGTQVRVKGQQVA